MKNLLRRFAKSRRGGVAIIFGLSLIPLVGFVGISVDYARSFGVRNEMQGALDAAALATASATNLTQDERVELGEKTFEASWTTKSYATMPTPTILIDYDTSTGEDTVTASAGSSVDTAMVGVLDIDQIDVGATSVARTVKAAPICVLALNKTAANAVDIQGGATLNSIGCAVHANSNHDEALNASGYSSALAEQFCAIGGYKGSNFTPKPKSCGYVEDPYKDLIAPDTSGCDYNNTQIKKQGGPVTLSPGVYCGGIDVQTQGIATFNPGMYVIKDGALSFSSGSTATGNGVTFYFTGTNTRLTVISTATVNLTAPTGGLYEGFIFIQDPLSNPGQLTGKQNEIQGGGSITIIGTIYFPTQPVTISGNGAFGINSPLMPIIADTITVTGNGVKTIQVDQDEANMLQDLPKATDGARLIN